VLKHRWVIKYVKISADLKLVAVWNWSIICGSCSFIGFRSSSCQGNVKFIFGQYQTINLAFFFFSHPPDVNHCTTMTSQSGSKT
jgi:hypothetical protein